MQSVTDSRRQPTAFAVTFALPVRDAGGQVNGTVNASFRLLPLKQMLEHANLPAGCVITLVDEQGRGVSAFAGPGPLGRQHV